MLYNTYFMYVFVCILCKNRRQESKDVKEGLMEEIRDRRWEAPCATDKNGIEYN